MSERVLILGLVALAIVAAWGAVRLWQGWRVRRMQAESPFTAIAPVGKPALIAFSSPSCGECRSRQAPALARLARELGDQVTLQTISAPDHPELVERAGILTVPATVVLDARGVVRHLNLGFADAARLAGQIRAVCEPRAAVV